MFFFSGELPSVEKPSGPYPTLVTQPSGRVVPVIQAYAYTKYLGVFNLTFNDNGEMESWNGSPMLLDHNIPEGKNAILYSNEL